MTINYYSKEVYGQTKYYFANADDRQSWYNLTGRKTINTADMSNIGLMFNVKFNRVFEGEV